MKTQKNLSLYFALGLGVVGVANAGASPIVGGVLEMECQGDPNIHFTLKQTKWGRLPNSYMYIEMQETYLSPKIRCIDIDEKMVCESADGTFKLSLHTFEFHPKPPPNPIWPEKSGMAYALALGLDGWGRPYVCTLVGAEDPLANH